MQNLTPTQIFTQIAQDIPYQYIMYKQVSLCIKRLDLIHPAISGNKFFKLKYNLITAKNLGYEGIITFGGAYSNHIAATAYAAQLLNFKSIGIIRGEELAHQPLNPTLTTASRMGMTLSFISRQQYRRKDQQDFIQQLQHDYPNFYIIPEGGTNDLAISGCKEILTPSDLATFKTVCCAVGTGGTISGIIEASHRHQCILGFSALKGAFLEQDVQQMTTKTNWKMTDNYCCGGYAKTTRQLLDFIKNFELEYQIPLEHIYTGKMLMGIFDLIDQNQITNNDKTLIIHSGGLQGRLASI